MLRIRVIALFVAVFLAFSAQPAKAGGPPDPCAPDVMTALTASAQSGFNDLNKLVTSIMKPPQSAQSSTCMRDLFNIWDTDLLSTLGGAIASFISSIFPFSSVMPGITLTESSVYKPIMSLVNQMLNNNLNKLVCRDMWKNVQTSMSEVIINPNGTFGIGAEPSITFDASTGRISIP